MGRTSDEIGSKGTAHGWAPRENQWSMLQGTLIYF